MIIDDWIRKGNCANCNILVTQPRRISAISLAKRVAKERREKARTKNFISLMPGWQEYMPCPLYFLFIYCIYKKMAPQVLNHSYHCFFSFLLLLL